MDIHFDALDRCRSAAKTASDDYAELDGEMPKTAEASTDAAIFGHVDSAAGLASAVTAAWGVLSDELAGARLKVKSVEQALVEVEDNVREGQRPTADAMRG